MPFEKSRRSKPFQVVRTAKGAPRLTPNPFHQLAGVAMLLPSASEPLEIKK